MLFSIFDVLTVFEDLQIFFYKCLLKMGKSEEDFDSSIFFKAQKCYLSYSQRCFNVARHSENRLWKRWNTQRCFNVVERYEL